MSNKTYSTGHGTGVGNETLLNDPSLCTLDTCDLSMASFDYIPSLGGNAIFAAIFGVLLLAQLFFGIRHRTWGYMTAMILGLLAEVIGYVARVLLNGSPFDNNDFLMYLICLTIAPALLCASIYLCLARIVNVYGQHLSRFRPGTYTIVFCTCDFICLVLQGAGGGLASTAKTQSGVNLGKNVMLAGLVIQVVSLSLFTVACVEFALRVSKGRGTWNPKYLYVANSKLFKAFLFGLATATVTISIRSVYRIAELYGGFNSTLFRSDQAMFMILEGAMITIATTCLTALHPGISFQGAWHEVNFSFRMKKEQLVTDDAESQFSQLQLGNMTDRK